MKITLANTLFEHVNRRAAYSPTVFTRISNDCKKLIVMVTVTVVSGRIGQVEKGREIFGNGEIPRRANTAQRSAMNENFAHGTTFSDHGQIPVLVWNSCPVFL